MYAFYLERHGFYVAVAADGEAGIRTAQSEPFDVIVMDLSMPRMDGVEATKQLKADARTREVPIIVVTGHALRGKAQEAVVAGARSYCVKPCLPEQLHEEIERALADGTPPDR